jgi:hypothetical protein
MADDPKNDQPAEESTPIEQLDALARGESDALPPRERFRKTSHIALLLAYDLIDKLRFWEKETLKLSDEEIAKRQAHLARSVEELRGAYLTFSDLEY